MNPLIVLDGAVNLGNLPAQLATAFGFANGEGTAGLFAGQVAATLIFTSLFLFPTMFLCSKFKRDALLPSLMIGFMGLIFGVVAFGLAYWILIVVSMLTAVMFAGSMRDWLSGTGR